MFSKKLEVDLKFTAQLTSTWNQSKRVLQLTSTCNQSKRMLQLITSADLDLEPI